MNRNLTVLVAAAAVAAPVAVATADEPKAPAAPAEIIAYHDSGEWDDDIAAVTDKAKKSLTTQLKKKPKKPAIVFDIDDTIESTYECAKKGNFERSAITLCTLNGDQDPIKQTKALYKYALKKKVAVYFITGRPESIREGTETQLKGDGFTKGTLLMTPTGQFGEGSSSIPKIAHRKAIEKDGFKILINVGDQKSDLSGGFSVKRYKLPNPMYFTG
jgi:predicted secreted acid phosphatase